MNRKFVETLEKKYEQEFDLISNLEIDQYGNILVAGAGEYYSRLYFWGEEDRYVCFSIDEDEGDVYEGTAAVEAHADALSAAGRCWYDLETRSELTVVEGPVNWQEEIDPEGLPIGFRWIEDEEWEALHESIEIVAMD